MHNQIDSSPSAVDDKRIYLAYWPNKSGPPDVWTYAQVEEVFGELPQIMELVLNLSYGEELHHEESNFMLVRIPSYLDVPKTKYQLTKQYNKNVI